MDIDTLIFAVLSPTADGSAAEVHAANAADTLRYPIFVLDVPLGSSLLANASEQSMTYRMSCIRCFVSRTRTRERAAGSRARSWLRTGMVLTATYTKGGAGSHRHPSAGQLVPRMEQA